MKKIYCEHGAMTEQIRDLARSGMLEIVHFPYDSDSNIRLTTAAPSAAQYRDLNLPIRDLPDKIADYSGSIHFNEILSIVGAENRRDALHIDSAFKHDCSIFVTKDRDILSKREELESLLGIRSLHPDEGCDLKRFIADC